MDTLDKPKRFKRIKLKQDDKGTFIVPFDYFLRWIHAQPADRKVNMHVVSNTKPDRCGCLMVEFARDHKLGTITSCSTKYWLRKGHPLIAKFDTSVRCPTITDLFPVKRSNFEPAWNAKSFGEMRKGFVAKYRKAA